MNEDARWLGQIKRLERKRKWIWLCAAMTFLAAYFHRTVTGVVADSLMRDFSIAQASELGMLSSIYFYTYAVLQVPSGMLADRYGPRLVISASIVIAAAGAAPAASSGRAQAASPAARRAARSGRCGRPGPVFRGACGT